MLLHRQASNFLESAVAHVLLGIGRLDGSDAIPVAGLTSSFSCDIAANFLLARCAALLVQGNAEIMRCPIARAAGSTVLFLHGTGALRNTFPVPYGAVILG